MTIENTENGKNIASKQSHPLLIFLGLIITPFLAVGATFSVFQTKPVYAEDYDLNTITHKKLNDLERGNISTGCASIQVSLRNLQKNDSKTRVLLGTSYQTLLTNYFSPLNIRLIKNNLPDINLSRVQTEMFASRNDFTNLFITYSQHLETLISLDCKNQPNEFYYELENVRFLREKLEDSVTKTNNIVSSHLQLVDQLKHNMTIKDSENQKKENQ
jgi:hypothetical protein